MSKEDILKYIGKLADKNKIEVWAVGGFVRDKLLDKDVKDIDFVVIGDGPAFAKKVASSLGTKNIVVFNKFQTAIVQYKSFQLEFVGARAESYIENSY